MDKKENKILERALKIEEVRKKLSNEEKQLAKKLKNIIDEKNAKK